MTWRGDPLLGCGLLIAAGAAVGVILALALFVIVWDVTRATV